MTSIDITRERALELAQEFIAGRYLKLKPDDIRVTVFGGGYCSRLYLIEDISSNNNSQRSNHEIAKFLVRLYGGKGLGDPQQSPLVTLNTESQILLFYEFGRLGLGPKLLGSFKGGRIEEFIASHTCGPDHLVDPQIRNQIARNLARYHHVKLPLSYSRLDYDSYITNCYNSYYTKEGQDWFKDTCKLSGLDPSWGSADFLEEMNWILQTESKIHSRIVLCNNDMNRNNVLVLDQRKANGERIMLIDYELSSYNPRGLDLGHHFVMWLAEFGRKDHPNGHFVSDMEYPSESIRSEFLRSYLEEVKKIAPFDTDTELDTLEHLQMESDFYGLKIVHFWICDSICPKPKGDPFDEVTIKVGFMGIAFRFWNWYKDYKKVFLSKYKL